MARLRPLTPPLEPCPIAGMVGVNLPSGAADIDLNDCRNHGSFRCDF
jgi:hypothetical protein